MVSVPFSIPLASGDIKASSPKELGIVSTNENDLKEFISEILGIDISQISPVFLAILFSSNIIVKFLLFPLPIT